MALGGSYQVLVEKTPEQYEKAKLEFFQFLTDQGLDALVSDRDRLFETLLGRLSQGTHPKVSHQLTTTNTFVPVADLEQTARWLSEGYKGNSVDGRQFNQTCREYYDTARYRFGMHTDLAPLGLSDAAMESHHDANLTALFDRETKTTPQLTALFEYAIGTLEHKAGRFEFKPGKGRKLAKQLAQHYEIKYEGVSSI